MQSRSGPYPPASAEREAYAAARSHLDQLARTVRPEQLTRVGDEVLAVADLLERTPRVRRALADPARMEHDRTALFDDLLAGKVTPEAAALVRILVAGRWSSAADLLDSAERLGVEALLASAESAGELARVEDEMFGFRQVVEGDLPLSAALGATSVPAAQRAALARRLLFGKVVAVTLRLVEQALHGFGGRGFVASLNRLVEQAADRRDRQIAYVSAARPLGEEQRRRLATRLSQLYGRPVELKVTVVASVVGGMSVRVGHDLYDGTLSTRLDQARAALAG